MNPVAPDPLLESAIDDTLARLRRRADTLGEEFAALVEAAVRAASGGKRLRPILVCEAYRAFQGEDERAAGVRQVAAAFELLHAAFVVHDDVIDHDTMRRGIPNVTGEFRLRARRLGADAAGAASLGDAAGILAGDLLLHEAVRQVALADLEPDVRRSLLDLIDEAVLVSAAGELADVENAVARDERTTEALLTTAFRKTAVYSFRAPLLAGAVLARAPSRTRDVLAQAADRLGLAYQLADDLIGAFGDEQQAGRAAGGDLREAKRTPLVALAGSGPNARRVDSALALARTGPVAVREAQRVLEASGARVRLRTLIDDALEEVRTAPAQAALPAGARDLIRRLADLVEGRIP